MSSEDDFMSGMSSDDDMLEESDNDDGSVAGMFDTELDLSPQPWFVLLNPSY